MVAVHVERFKWLDKYSDGTELIGVWRCGNDGYKDGNK